MCEFDLKMVSIENGSVDTAGTAAAVRTRLFNWLSSRDGSGNILNKQRRQIHANVGQRFLVLRRTRRALAAFLIRGWLGQSSAP